MKRLIFLPILFTIVTSDSCIKKFYPKATSFVCVCNSAGCDSLPKIESVIDDDNVVVFESNAKEYRLHKEVKKFENSSLDDEGSHHPQAIITINPAKTDQTILGFGAAFTDSAGINLKTLDEKLQRHLIQDYFHQEGLEINMARVPIGGCDCSNRNYTLDDFEDDFELEHFALTEEDFDFKIPYILMAKNMSKNLRLWASSWSSPIWMKTNHAIDGLGILIGEPGQFYWKLYANYIIKFLNAYKSHGIDFWGLTTANEPGIGLIPYMGWNQLGFSPEMMREWIKKDLGPALKAAGYGRDKLKLMMLDDNINDMVYHVETVLRDEEAAQYIDGISFHWYATRFMGSWDVIEYIHKKFPDKFMMMTEACGVGGVLFGDWGRGEAYSIDIIEDLNHGSVGWADWNLALNPQGGPNWARAWNDASIIVNGSISEYYRQPTFYSLAHFTKFLQPGSVRILHTLITKRKGLRTTVFRNVQGNFVLVLLNTDDKSADVVIKGFRKIDFKAKIGPHSIQTYVTKSYK